GLVYLKLCAPEPTRCAAFPGCGFCRLSGQLSVRASGTSPEPAGSKVCSYIQVSWGASGRFCARIGTVKHPLTRPPVTLSPIGGEGRGWGLVHGRPEDLTAVVA